MPIGKIMAPFSVGPTADHWIYTWVSSASSWGKNPDYTPFFQASLGPDDLSNDFGWKMNNHMWENDKFGDTRENWMWYKLGTDMIDLDEDVLDAGSFTWNTNTPDSAVENPDAEGYIGSNMSYAGGPLFYSALYYQTTTLNSFSGEYNMRAVGWPGFLRQYQAPYTPTGTDRDYQRDGYFRVPVSSQQHDGLVKLLTGYYDPPYTPVSDEARSRCVYVLQTAYVYSSAEGFQKGGYIYPESLITSTSGESVYSNATGWSVVGGASADDIRVLQDGRDDTYVELEPGKKIVMKLSKPAISFSDFSENPSGKGDSLTRPAYTVWVDDDNYKYMEMRFASVTHDGINTRMDWWYDKDATLPASRLRNTSTAVDISECPITVFGSGGSPTGDTTEVAWEQETWKGLTVAQQSDHRMLIRNNSTTAGENVRISQARCRLGPGIFGFCNPSQNYLEFTPSYGS